MSRTLNRNKPYGELWGDNLGSAKFQQDGIFFDHAGVECAAPGAPETKQPVLADGPAISGSDGGQKAPQKESEPQIDAQTIVNARRGELMMRVLPILEGKADDIVAELEDHDVDLLEVMLEAEGLMKKRKSVVEGLQTAIAAKKTQEAADKVANGIPTDAAPTTAATSTLPPGTADQLASQLQS